MKKIERNKIKDTSMKVEGDVDAFNSGTYTDKQLLNVYDTYNAIQTYAQGVTKEMWLDPTLKKRITAARKKNPVPVLHSVSSSPSTSPSAAPPEPDPEPIPSHDNWFSGAKMLVNPTSVVANYTKDHPNDANIEALKYVASQPTSQWIAEWSGPIYDFMKGSLAQHKNAGTLPVYSVYNIPNRDNGSYSGGGADGADKYMSWIKDITKAAVEAGKPEIIYMFEADALGHTHDWEPAKKEARYKLMRDAITELNASGGRVYIDTSFWWAPNEVIEMWKILEASGIDKLAYGFVVNTSGFTDTDICYQRAMTLSNLWSVKAGRTITFVIDTSRNGNGEYNGFDGQEPWCNPPGRALGVAPLKIWRPRLDANIWVKVPGESDGTCRGGPNAGELYYGRLVEMYNNAKKNGII